MDKRLLTLLNGNEAVYPHSLQQQFPRILKKIIEQWNTPEIENYFYDLMVDTRNGTRQGFPAAVASDIFNLQKVYNVQHIHVDETSSVWGEIPEEKRLELERLGYTPTFGCFVKAIETGHEDAVEVFLSCGIDVESRDERYWTPMIITAFHGHTPIASILVKRGAKVQVEDRNGYTPLHWSAFNGHTRVVELLLKNGAAVDATSSFGWTALMQAATRGHVPTVTQLLVYGAKVNETTADGWTALHKAAANGNGEIVLQLLEKGADRTITYPDGSTALSLASKNNHDQIVRLLRSFRPPKTS